ncbi:MAG: insulinase family protein, partial [Planctomycetes bacterium]|nr:insulinase family protein [Planctomycetota bacterium]
MTLRLLPALALAALLAPLAPALLAREPAAAAAALQSATKKPPASYTAEAPPWEHERSDLKPDPRFHFGKFANGLRYAWADHANPPRQVRVRLFVAIGSLAERGDEVGLAHFLEHMAFNGSKSFKAGTLVPTFQAQGIRFGSDVNAHTGFDETVYELDLPDADPARLEQALAWFRDVVDGLKLDGKEIEAEKGVVDAEQEARSSKGFDRMVERLGLLLDGSRFPRRLPIGEQPVRAQFDKKRVTAFYDRWYRPERCTLLLVGDLGGQDPTAAIEKAFATARGRGKAEEPPGGELDGLTFAKTLFTEPAGGGLTLYVAKGRPPADVGDDAKSRLATLDLAVACDVLEERLNAMVPRAFVTASVASGARFHPATDLVGHPVMEGVSLRLATDLNHWQMAVQQAEREVRRFLERGISDAEWSAALERLTEELAEPSAPATPTSAELIEQLLDACRGRRVPMEAAADRAAWRAAAAKLDRARSSAAFASEWKGGKLVLATVGELDLRDSAREMLEEAWKAGAASNLDVKPIVRDDLSAYAPKKEKKPASGGASGSGSATAGAAAPAAAPFPYALPDAPATPTTTVELAKLRARRVDFGNGVRAIVRQEEGSSGRFRFTARVGRGLLGLEAAQCDVAKAAERVVADAATKKLKREELDAALATAGGALDFAVGGDACVFSGRAQGGGGEAGLRRALETLVALL